MPETDSTPSTTSQQEAWFRVTTRCAVELRDRFGAPDKRTEERMVRVFRAALRPRQRAGRRPNDVTVRAAEMWLAGMRERAVGGKRTPLRLYQRLLWQRIYREIFPDFQRLDKLTRQ